MSIFAAENLMHSLCIAELALTILRQCVPVNEARGLRWCIVRARPLPVVVAMFLKPLFVAITLTLSALSVPACYVAHLLVSMFSLRAHTYIVRSERYRQSARLSIIDAQAEDAASAPDIQFYMPPGQSGVKSRRFSNWSSRFFSDQSLDSPRAFIVDSSAINTESSEFSDQGIPSFVVAPHPNKQVGAHTRILQRMLFERTDPFASLSLTLLILFYKWRGAEPVPSLVSPWVLSCVYVSGFFVTTAYYYFNLETRTFREFFDMIGEPVFQKRFHAFAKSFSSEDAALSVELVRLATAISRYRGRVHGAGAPTDIETLFDLLIIIEKLTQRIPVPKNQRLFKRAEHEFQLIFRSFFKSRMPTTNSKHIGENPSKKLIAQLEIGHAEEAAARRCFGYLSATTKNCFVKHFCSLPFRRSNSINSEFLSLRESSSTTISSFDRAPSIAPQGTSRIGRIFSFGQSQHEFSQPSPRNLNACKPLQTIDESFVNSQLLEETETKNELQQLLWKTENSDTNFVISLIMRLLEHPLVSTSNREFLRQFISISLVQQRASKLLGSGQKHVFFEDKLAPYNGSMERFSSSFITHSSDILSSVRDHIFKPRSSQPQMKIGATRSEKPQQDYVENVMNFLELNYTSRVFIPKPTAFTKSYNTNVFDEDMSLSSTSYTSPRNMHHKTFKNNYVLNGCYSMFSMAECFKIPNLKTLDVHSKVESPRGRRRSTFVWDICDRCYIAATKKCVHDIDPSVSPEQSRDDFFKHFGENVSVAYGNQLNSQETYSDELAISHEYERASESKRSASATGGASDYLSGYTSQSQMDKAYSLTPVSPSVSQRMHCNPRSNPRTLMFFPDPDTPFTHLLKQVFVYTQLTAELFISDNAIAKFLGLVEFSFKCSRVKKWGASYYARLSQFIYRSRRAPLPLPRSCDTCLKKGAKALSFPQGAKGALPLRDAHATRNINVYHTVEHTAYVLQFLFLILSSLVVDFPSLFTPIEVLSLLLAALSLDIFHSGFSDRLLISSLHPLAILYNDRKVQRMHAAHHGWSFIVESQILQGLSDANQVILRSNFIRLVLSVEEPLSSKRVLSALAEFKGHEFDRTSAFGPPTSKSMSEMSGEMDLRARGCVYESPAALIFGSSTLPDADRNLTLDAGQKEALMVTILNIAACSDFMRPAAIARCQAELLLFEYSQSAELMGPLFPDSSTLALQRRLARVPALRAFFLRTLIQKFVAPNLRDYRAFLAAVNLVWHKAAIEKAGNGAHTSPRRLCRKHAPCSYGLLREIETNLEDSFAFWCLETMKAADGGPDV